MTERAQKIMKAFNKDDTWDKEPLPGKIVVANVLREIVSDYESWEDGTYMVKSKDILEIADELDELEDT